MEDIKDTLENLNKTQKQVTDENGRTYIMRLRPYQTTNGKIEGVVITFVDITELTAAQAELAGKIEEIKELQRQILKINVNERWKVGQHLHDEVAQSLVAAEIMLDSLKSNLEESENDLTAEIDEITDIFMTSVDHIRDLSHEILPIDVEARGMGHSFDQLAKRMRKIYHLNCEITLGKEIEDMDDIEAAISLYRLAEEAAKNAALHGQAENIKITVQMEDDHLCINIEDDGVGFAAAQDGDDDEPSGMGINIMRHRMELMGGTLEISESSHFENTGALVSGKIPQDGEK
jgi:signal transduction histidine kinase